MKVVIKGGYTKDNFEEIYTKYYPRVLSFCKNKISSDMDAEDVSQIAFIKCYLYIESFRNDKAQFSTWLFTIAKNECITYYHSKKDYIDSIEGKNIDIPYEVNMNNFWNSDILTKINYQIKKLPLRDEQILRMRFYKGMKSQEIGKILNIREINVNQIVHRALQKLKTKLEYLNDEV